MRFNFLLLLLTTLIAVALSQDWKPCQVNIKLKNTKLFWAIDTRRFVILQNPKSSSPLKLTTVPFNVPLGSVKGSSIDRFHGESVQSLGPNKQLLLLRTNLEPTQCWHFHGDFIHPCNNHTQALTAERIIGTSIITVKLKHKTGSNSQKWVVSKAK
ncbi:unnamed protein product [Rhizophagus irregularis]|uniref:Ricin B lectin domain-containing protein n=1 Tax=Rhizophagus irregularis TaxID=588596 RepID=A0A2I1FWC4_9GLOM|nr:hypothetical protein RhiirA4_451730 [Rhizophagus irregularis]CAB4403106.1 unnamed protein product [Rhizophagus irregularis]